MIIYLNEISLECFHGLSFQQKPIPGREPEVAVPSLQSLCVHAVGWFGFA